MADTTLTAPAPAADPEPRAPGDQRIPHVAALDGIRALAVLAVMAYHHFSTQTTSLLPGGFLGVDVFFVLSGFLITTLLLIDHERTGKVISWRFWERRLRRLLPAVLLLLLIVSIYAKTLAASDELSAIRRGALATLLYVQNYWQLYRSGEFPLQLGHTWSLSIEEQFYLLWPIGLAGLLWTCRRRTRLLPWLIGTIVIASTLRMAAVYHPKSPWRAYLGLDTRAHELLVGALLAVMLMRLRGCPLPRRAARALEAAGALGIAALGVLFATTHYQDAWLFRGGFLAVSLTTAMVIAAVMQPTSRLTRTALGWRPLAAIGLISYGLYLFHIPIYSFVSTEHTGLDGIALGIARFAATFAVAIASYHLIEQPVRRHARWLPPMRLLAPVAIGLTVVALFVATLGATAPPSADERTQAYYSFASTAPAGSTRVLFAGDIIAYTLGTTKPMPYSDQGIHAVSVSKLTCGLARGVIVEGGSPYISDYTCGRQTQEFADAARAFAPHVVVISFGAADVFSHEVDDQLLEFGTTAYERHLRTRLDRLRAALTAGGAATVLTTTPCMQPADGGAFPALDAGRADPSRLAWLNGVWRRYTDDHPDVTLADLDAWLCANGARRVDPVVGPLGSPDGITLSPAGSRALWEWLAPIAVGARPGAEVQSPYGGG